MKEIEVYQIDSDVPVPEENFSRGVPLERLEVGESIAFPLDKRRSVASMASKLKKDVGREFTVHKVNDTEVRVWRIT